MSRGRTPGPRIALQEYRRFAHNAGTPDERAAFVAGYEAACARLWGLVVHYEEFARQFSDSDFTNAANKARNTYRVIRSLWHCSEPSHARCRALDEDVIADAR